MNYLAHLYLSQADDDLALGNFIADFVKGNQYKTFREGVAQGILMHREIDFTTDNHPDYISTKELFKSSHGRYSGIVTDIVFDYILAKDWEKRNRLSLSEFQSDVNTLILNNFKILPLKTKMMAPFFIRNKWLMLYAAPDTLHQVLSRMQRYRGVQGNSGEAISILMKHEATIKKAFNSVVDTIFKQVVIKYQLTSKSHQSNKNSKIIRI
ncbi:MAG: ACP phosphodiesterase [Salinivirgaceae bacterium]|nr:ACP phosphodiesterase [Salinivirgaceae bacterium]